MPKLQHNFLGQHKEGPGCDTIETWLHLRSQVSWEPSTGLGSGTPLLGLIDQDLQQITLFRYSYLCFSNFDLGQTNCISCFRGKNKTKNPKICYLVLNIWYISVYHCNNPHYICHAHMNLFIPCHIIFDRNINDLSSK